MSGGGSKPGERRGGRQIGSLNKKTIERMLLEERAARAAEQEQARAKAAGRLLAKERLEELMNIYVGATAFFQPTLPQQLAAGHPPNPNANWDKFERWSVHLMRCAAELATYQSPRLQAVMVAPAPDTNQPEKRKRFTLTIFEGGVPTAIAQVESKRKAG